MSFEVGTVIVVLVIFSVFLWAALKAEKVVAAQARQKRDAQQKALAAKAATAKSTGKK